MCLIKRSNCLISAIIVSSCFLSIQALGQDDFSDDSSSSDSFSSDSFSDGDSSSDDLPNTEPDESVRDDDLDYIEPADEVAPYEPSARTSVSGDSSLKYSPSVGLSVQSDSVETAPSKKPRDVKKTKYSKKNQDRKLITELQKSLNKNGSKIKVDGLMGKNTRNAIKKFQQQHKMIVSGNLDLATLKKLGVK